MSLERCGNRVFFAGVLLSGVPIPGVDVATVDKGLTGALFVSTVDKDLASKFGSKKQKAPIFGAAIPHC
jgi:hypothetical protein